MNKTLVFREAEETDLFGIVQMLADDPLGAKREHLESPLPESYRNAFRAIAEDPNNQLIVATLNGKVAGVLQLTRIPSLTYQGSPRAQVEGVRIAKKYRSQGIGRELFQWAINRSRELGCHLVQLTTDKARPEALLFYESLGFIATHEGMKLRLKAQ